ncbi:MAG: glycine--tRNA ligase [Firmicutes bacterium]|nr:glycine--tRNA ligase [Bacillota bacterium]
MDEIVSLAKRRGFVFQSSEIYGGFSSCWDYGPLGAELKRNVKQAWWKAVVQMRSDVVGSDTSILMHPDVWRASGHVDNFTDPLVDCRECRRRYRADHLEQTETCPDCGGELTPARKFNLMFKTHAGPVEDSAAEVFLRPETAQGIFVNFALTQNTSRKKPPFGIAQIGKSFRNEVTPGNFIFRTREFEQMELEYFVPHDQADEYYKYWVEERFQWYKDLGVNPENLRLRPHEADELAHYARSCEDVEYKFPFGWQELEGIAHRGTFDLDQHINHSGKDLSYFDTATNQRYVPICIESSAGVDRALLTFLVDAYTQEPERVVLKFHPDIAPIKAAVLPLSKKPQLAEVSQRVFALLAKHMAVDYDETGSIGKRYRRQDEIGTPYCVTVDFDTLDDQAVTIRERDSMEQERVAIDQLLPALRDKLDM